MARKAKRVGVTKKRKSTEDGGGVRVKKSKKSSDGVEEDQFDKISDDVMTDILGRINDAKFLTQSLLVSKRIASIIPTLACVSTDILNPNPKYYYDSQQQQHLLICNSDSVVVNYNFTTGTTTSSYTAKFCPLEYGQEMRSDFFASKAREKLGRFIGIQKAIMEYPYFDDYMIGGMLDRAMKWKVEYSSSNVIKSCSLLGADYYVSAGGSPPDEFYADGINFDISRRLSWLATCLKFARNFRPMVVQMARDHPSLRDITITSKAIPRACIHAGEEEIMKMRRRSPLEEEEGEEDAAAGMHMKVKLWHVPTMVLPPWDEGITGVTFMVATTISDDSDDDDDDTAAAAISRFWGGYNGPAEHSMTQTIHAVEKQIATVVDKTPPTIDINTTWHWNPTTN